MKCTRRESIHRHLCYVITHISYRVPGEIKRREVELDPQPRRDHEQGGGAGLRKIDFFRLGLFLRQQQCNGHCLCNYICPSTAFETAIAQCTSRWAMARRHRLNTSIVLAVVHGRSVPVPVPNKPPRFCGRKAKWSRSRHVHSSGAV